MQMPARGFFDTNVLIYAIAGNDPRSTRAEALLATGGVVSVQILNEFVSVVRRKLRMSWTEVNEALEAIRVLCPSPVPVSVTMHERALRVAEAYRYEIYDALVIAAALEAGCGTLYSEDLQDGQVIEGRLTVRNPFA
jgi:predicted nucleic acid-binding protein